MRFRQTKNIFCTTTMFSKIPSVFAAVTLILSGAAWADQIVVGMAAMSSFQLPFWTTLEKKYFGGGRGRFKACLYAGWDVAEGIC
jgi:hypothetical protein